MKSKSRSKKTETQFNPILVVAIFLFGFVGGYFLPFRPHTETTKAPLMKMAEKRASESSQMAHEQLHVKSTDPAPSVVLTVVPDDKSGYNVNVQTTNFAFTPENASQEHVMNQGHAHLYVNGNKIARMYGTWFHIPVLEPGENEIRVTLNTNDHKDYAVDGKTIEDAVTVSVSEEEHNATPHDH